MKHRKLLSVLLALVMMLQLVPTAVFADGNGAADGTPAYAGVQEDDPTAPVDGETGTDPAAPADGETGTDPAAPTDGETGTDPAAPTDEGAAYGLRALDAPLTVVNSGHLTISGDTSYIDNGKYLLSKVGGKQFKVEYKNNGGAAAGTVVVIECLEYGATFANWPNEVYALDGTTLVATVQSIDDHRLALVLEGGAERFEIGFAMKYAPLTDAQAEYIIDNDKGVPTTRIAAAEYVSIDSIDTAAPTEKPAVLCSAEPDFSDETITQTHAYNYAVSALAPITNYMLRHRVLSEMANPNEYNWTDPDRKTVALRYQLPDITNGGALMEIQSIKLYAPSDKLKLGEVLGYLYGGNEALTLITADSSKDDYAPVDFWWGDWTISGPMKDEGDREYYLLTPKTRVLNTRPTRPNATQPYAAFYPIWQLKDIDDPLPSDSDSSDGLDYTPFEAADTVITYKLPGGGTATKNFTGPKLYTFAQQTRDVTIGYDPARMLNNSKNAAYKVVCGADYNGNTSAENHFLDVSNSSYIQKIDEGDTHLRTDYTPAYTGPVTQIFVFPYEIQPTGMTLNTGIQHPSEPDLSDQYVLPGGAEKTIESITYWTKDKVDAYNNPIGDGYSVDVTHSDATDNAHHPAVDGNGTYGFTDNSITSDNPVKIVKIKWSCLANKYRCGNYDQYGDRPTEKVYFNYQVATTDKNGNQIQDGTDVQVTFTQKYGDSDDTTTPSDNYLWFRLISPRLPRLVGRDGDIETEIATNNGTKTYPVYQVPQDYLPSSSSSWYYYPGCINWEDTNREGEDVFGDVGIYIGNVGEYAESVTNPVIELYTKIGDPGLTGITGASVDGNENVIRDNDGNIIGDQCLAMLTGKFTATPRLKGWHFEYTTKKGTGEKHSWRYPDPETGTGVFSGEEGTVQIPLYGEYLTSLKLKYDGDFNTSHPTGSENDKRDKNVIWLMKNIKLKPFAVNPFTKAEVKTAEDYTATKVQLRGELRGKWTPVNSNVEQSFTNSMTRVYIVAGDPQNNSSTYVTASLWSTRKAMLDLLDLKRVDPDDNVTERTEEDSIQTGGLVQPTWRLNVRAIGGDLFIRNKPTSGDTYLILPWQDIREAVYVELTDTDHFDVDLTQTEFFGYPVDGETVKSETVTVTDADGTNHTFLKLRFAENFIRKNHMARDKGIYSTFTDGQNKGWWHEGIDGNDSFVGTTNNGKAATDDAGGLLKLGLTANLSTSPGDYHPVGDIYFDFSELLAKYHASINEADEDKSGWDYDRTCYVFTGAVEDEYGLSPTSVTGDKLFKIDGSGYTVQVTGAGGDVINGGTLKIKKTATGAQVPAGTTFTITGTPTTPGVTFETVTVSYADFENGVYTLAVPFGTYTVTEDTDSAAVAGYTLTVSGNGVEQQIGKGDTVEFAIKNTYVELVTISGAKTWADDNNRDGSRPDSITINLMNGNTTVASKAVTANDNWAWSFTVPKNENGQAINYTIEEAPVAGYTPEVSGYNVTNTHEIETVTISGAKTWADDDNRDGSRPASITINLMNGNTTVASKAVTVNDNWAWSFTVPKNENGEEIDYTVTEDEVPGYTATVDGYNVTNTHEIETVTISGAKTWADDDNRDGSRPASITINLMNGNTTVESKSVTAADNWAWSFTVPKNENGQEINYTITEKEVPGYTATVDGYNVTNTHEIETVTISGAKTWADDNNRDGSRPDSITINLMNGQTKVASKDVTVNDNWAWSFTVPKNENGQAISYTITEEPVAGYTATVDGYNVTNTHEIETVTISGAKTWADDNNRDGSRPASITINLMNGDATVASKTVTADDNWAWSFTVPKNENGQEINYTIEEKPVAGYTATVSGYNVTNERDLGTLKIVKTAEGAQVPAGTTFTITGTPIAGKFDPVTVTYADFTDGVYTLENVPTGDYTVTEDVDGAAVDGYTLTVSGNGETETLGKNETVDFAIENAYELDLGTLRITKTVTGTTMPGDVSFTITGTPVAADVTFETRTVRYADFENGVYTLENVPTGEYTVTEDVNGAAVAGYTLTVSGNGETMTLGKGETAEFSIENAYELDLGTLQIVKKTEGAQTPAGTRFTITGTPVAEDVTFETRTVRYADFENGVYTLENVPTGDYTVTEDVDGAALVGYKLTVTGDNGATKTLEKNGTVKFTILNKYERTPNIPDNPTPPPTPELNTKDHYAYIIGYPDGEVKPNGTITRAETVTIFFRMLTDESRDAIWSTENSFTDVQLTEWFNNAISTMENGGIINGYPDGSFNPNGNITRAEFAAMAIRFFQDAKVGPSKFSDTIGHWAAEAISKAQNEGLIMGYPDGTFHPDQPITRAEAMTIFNRVLKRAPHKDHLVANMIQWPDNMNKAVWYYADVQEATNSHTYTMSDTTTSAHEIWQKLLPVRDWEAFEKAWSTAHSASNPGEVVNN